jgi:hypothetical protein
LSRLRIFDRKPSIEIAVPAKYGSPHTTGNFPRHTSVHDTHVGFQIPYVYDYITKLCRKQAEVIQNHENEMFATMDKPKPSIENIKGFNLAVVICTTAQVSRLPW